MDMTRPLNINKSENDTSYFESVLDEPRQKQIKNTFVEGKEDEVEAENQLIEGLIVEEERSKGRVKFTTYGTYLYYTGGCKFILIVLGVMFLYTILGIGS